MILCVNKDALKVSEELQKNVKLEEIMLNHTKYYNSVEDAQKENFVPLDFMVSIRSVYSNLVLQYPAINESGFRYYVNLTNIDVLPHKGIDLIMYLSSIGIMKSVDYKLGFDNIMMKSTFSPQGIYNPLPDLMNPIVYSHIILADDTIDLFKNYLKEGISFVPIKDMKCKGNIQKILDSLIIVKECEDNEKTENDC